MKFVVLLLASVALLHSEDLNTRVMVVYNSNGDDSRKVAKYYMEKRGIPKENICKIDTDIDHVDRSELFEPEVKKPIRACLEKLGKQKILYIVLSYQTPYVVMLSGHGQAVDQLIADIWDEYAAADVQGMHVADQPYYEKAETQGNVYEPFVTLAKYREQAGAKNIYSVWRLDGATADIARGLVDKAMSAEANGLHGNAYFDIRGPIQYYVDTGYGAGEWDIYQASQMAKRAGFPVTLDDKPSEFGTEPSQMRCENAALYAGWYSLNHYNDVFTWVPGAIGFHLDSASAMDPRSSTNWAGGALQRGITITSGSVAEPYLEGLVHPDRIFWSLFQGANAGDAVLRGTRWLKWMIINIGDPLYRPFPNGIGVYGQAKRTEAFFVLAAQNMVGGGTLKAQFALAEKRDQTIPVTFSTNYPALLTLPTNVSIPPSATGAQFQIGVKGTQEQVSATITITAGNETLSNTLNLFPALSGLTLSQPSVKAEGTVTGTVSTVIAAVGSGFVIKLSSNQPQAIVPDEVTIQPGAKQATFTIKTKAVTAEVNAKIKASIDNATKTAELRITP